MRRYSSASGNTSSGTFSIVFFIIGAAIVFGIQVAKSVYDKKQLAKAEEKIEEE